MPLPSKGNAYGITPPSPSASKGERGVHLSPQAGDRGGLRGQPTGYHPPYPPRKQGGKRRALSPAGGGIEEGLGGNPQGI